MCDDIYIHWVVFTVARSGKTLMALLQLRDLWWRLRALKLSFELEEMFWLPLHPWFLGGKEDQPSYTSAFAERGKVSKPLKKEVKLPSFLETLSTDKSRMSSQLQLQKWFTCFFIGRVLKIQFILHSCTLCWFESLSHWSFWKKRLPFSYYIFLNWWEQKEGQMFHFCVYFHVFFLFSSARSFQ